MRFYEYLRRLYIVELILVFFITVVCTSFLYLKSIENNTLVIGFAIFITLPIIIEFIWLQRHKNISSFKSLVKPRVFHVLVNYLIIMGIGIFLEALHFEYLLLIPLGIATAGYHPFLTKKTITGIFITGIVSAIGLFVKDALLDYHDPNAFMFNSIFLVFVFILTAVIMWQVYLVHTRSNLILKENKKNLKASVDGLTKTNNELDSLIYKLTNDFTISLTSIQADFTAIDELSNDETVLIFTKHGNKYALELQEQILKLKKISQNAHTAILSKPCDVNSLVLESLNHLQNDILQAQVEVQIEPYEGDIINSDCKRVGLIIQNLIENAIKFRDEQKEVCSLFIKLKPVNEGILVSFIDNGIGIPEENKSKVFDMFYQGCEDAQGEGLGLYSVKEMARKLNGTISLNSEVNKGSRFDLYLPSKSFF